MLQRLLRRLTYTAYRDELNDIAVRHGKEMGLLRRKNDRLTEFYNDLSDTYEALLKSTTKKGRDGT